MSWEDCGFKPGKIYGPEKCPRTCGDCDGEHHFYAHATDDDGNEIEPHFACKHCDVTAEMVDDDEDEFEEMVGVEEFWRTAAEEIVDGEDVVVTTPGGNAIVCKTLTQLQAARAKLAGEG